MPAASSSALVLTAPPSAGALDAAAIALARAALPSRNHPRAVARRRRGLGSPVCAETPRTARRFARAWPLPLAPRPIDVNIVPGDMGLRRKKLLVADMESTIIQQECLDELADRVGLGAQIAAITERAMRGELDFEAALKERVGLLRGLDAGVLERVYETRDADAGRRDPDRDHAQARRHLRARLGRLHLLHRADRRPRWASTCSRPTRSRSRTAGSAGTVAEPILGREAKLAALERLARERGLDASETMAVGDGANDLAMIKAAGLGVAFRAKPIVAAEAAASVMHGDLTALLYLQGYTRAEFA